jgi:hypothetical protein
MMADPKGTGDRLVRLEKAALDLAEIVEDLVRDMEASSRLSNFVDPTLQRNCCTKLLLLFHLAAHGCAVEGRSSLQQALFWMNLYLALLAVQQKALGQMRKLVAGHPGRSDQYAPDVQLVETEIERVLTRLEHWKEVVDMANRAATIT